MTFAVTPVVRRLSLRLGWIDHPSDRKVHPKPTPTAGGLAMYLGVAAGLLAARVIPFLSGLHETSSELDAAFVAATIVVVLGLVDDTRGVSAIGKLAGQVLAAGIVVLLGVQLLYFYFPGQGVLSLSPDLAVPLTVLWIVALMNAVNLVDGLDGLAAGMVAIAAIAFFAYFRTPDGGDAASVAALMSTIVAGVALGFLPWNFYPAKIFMGDSGALLLGMLMAVATISGVGQNLEGPSGGDLAAIAIPIAIPLLVLAVPLLDVVLAIVRRMRKGIGIAHADKEHIHHRLMDIGHSHRQAVLLMYLWSALIAGAALVVAYVDGRFLVGAILISGIVVATVLPRLIRDRTPRGSDRPLPVARSGRRPGRHRRGAGSDGGGPSDDARGRRERARDARDGRRRAVAFGVDTGAVRHEGDVEDARHGLTPCRPPRCPLGAAWVIIPASKASQEHRLVLLDETGGCVPDIDVRLERVTKAFGDAVAVDDLSLDISEGEFFSMLGPSGCGKTTTLRMIGGFEDPSRGTVYLGGRDVTDLPSYKRDVNTVFQSYALFPHLDVFENVAFGLRRKKVPKDEVRSRVVDALRLVEMSGFETRKPGQMSGRPAAARGARPSPGQPAQGAPARRAARRPGPQAAQADAAGAEADPAGGRDHLHLRHARPGRGDDDVRPPRGDAARSDRADGWSRGGLRASRHAVRGELPRRQQPAPGRDEGRVERRPPRS